MKGFRFQQTPSAFPGCKVAARHDTWSPSRSCAPIFENGPDPSGTKGNPTNHRPSTCVEMATLGTESLMLAGRSQTALVSSDSWRFEGNKLNWSSLAFHKWIFHIPRPWKFRKLYLRRCPHRHCCFHPTDQTLQQKVAKCHPLKVS